MVGTVYIPSLRPATARAGWRALFALACLFVIGVLAAPAHAQVEASEYYLGPGDKLNVTVFGHADLSGEFEIDSAGFISLPLMGQIEAAGRTVRALQGQLEERLDKEFIVDPRVSIEVRNFRPFFILGQVNKPGSYPYQSGIDIRQAIAIGGGFTRRAKTDAVLLIRRTAEGKVRYQATLDVPVLPGDTIEVERRLF
ncbi:MAG: polysaccharide export protein [Alphaproteobacteria bacterium]|nr:polysaccharide export protein [Alphaproteobacteria bacterium]